MGRAGRGFFQDHMSIGPPDPERADSRIAGLVSRRPIGYSGVNVKRAVLKIDVWIGLFEMQARNQDPVLQCQGSLD